jgi:hypothetical protein
LCFESDFVCFSCLPFCLSSSFSFFSRCAVLEWRRPSAGLQPCTRAGRAGATNAGTLVSCVLSKSGACPWVVEPCPLVCPGSSPFLAVRRGSCLSVRQFVRRSSAGSSLVDTAAQAAPAPCVRPASASTLLQEALAQVAVRSLPVSLLVRSSLSVRLQAAVLASKSLCSVLIRCREYRFKQ